MVKEKLIRVEFDVGFYCDVYKTYNRAEISVDVKIIELEKDIEWISAGDNPNEFKNYMRKHWFGYDERCSPAFRLWAERQMALNVETMARSYTETGIQSLVVDRVWSAGVTIEPMEECDDYVMFVDISIKNVKQ